MAPFWFPLSYAGYVPQFPFRFGDTYGKTTHKLLLDPTVSKSPRSLLAPLDNKFLELRYQIDHPGEQMDPANEHSVNYQQWGLCPLLGYFPWSNHSPGVGALTPGEKQSEELELLAWRFSCCGEESFNSQVIFS